MGEGVLGSTAEKFMVWRGARALRIGAWGALAVLIVAEVAVRACGLVSFPLYRADAYIGYWASPGQSGRFLNKNRWVFNERSMGVAEAFRPDRRPDVLLIGDSIVLGGNPLDQADRLGPRMMKLTGHQHWPVSAGSWSLLNELHFLKRNMDIVAGSDVLRFVLNSADFEHASSWSCEITHPRERPHIALMYVIKKYVFASSQCSSITPADLKVPAGDWRVAWRELMSDVRVQGKPVEVWLYPTRDESLNVALLRTRLEAFGTQLRVPGLSGLLVVRSLGRDHRWPGLTYADAIHPDVAGVGLLSVMMSFPSPETILP